MTYIISVISVVYYKSQVILYRDILSTVRMYYTNTNTNTHCIIKSTTLKAKKHIYYDI